MASGKRCAETGAASPNPPYSPARLLPLLILLLTSLAWASRATPIPCAEQPYTLETPQGIAGGGSLEFDGDLAIFSDGACLQAEGLSLRAPSLRFYQASGALTATDIEVETPRYRLWAEKSTVTGRVLQASGIRATTCVCGDDLRFLSQALWFDTQTGEIILKDTRLEVFRFGLAHFGELRLDPDQPIGQILGLVQEADAPLILPVRFDFDQGLNLGLSDFPLLEAGAAPSRFTTRLTLLGLRLGSPDPVLRLGLAVQEASRRASFQFDSRPSGFASRSEVVDGPLFFVHDSQKGRYAFGLRQAFVLEHFTLIPFAWAAQDWQDGTPATQVQGLAAGVELRYKFELQEGPFRFRLEPFGLAALYNQPQQFLAYGGLVEGRYEGNFALRLGYTWAAESTPARFWLERRGAIQRLSGSLQYPGLRLEGVHDFLNDQTQGNLRVGYSQDFGEVWAQFNSCWNCVGKTFANGRGDWEQRELVVGFTPSPISYTFDLSLAPLLGYDFLRQGVSRWGLELRYADCCFVWRLGFQEIRIAQNPSETAAGRLTFGLEIR